MNEQLRGLIDSHEQARREEREAEDRFLAAMRRRRSLATLLINELTNEREKEQAHGDRAE